MERYMIPNEMNYKEKRFEDAWRHWLEKSSQPSARYAASKILDRLDPPRLLFRSWMPVGALTGLLLVISLSYLWMPGGRERGWQGLLVNEPEAVQLHPDEILIWLDEQTPLYMNYPSADRTTGGGTVK
jgi:hypothetical protein